MSLSIEQIFLSDNFYNDEEENTEVIVFLSNGEKYTASFFSFENILQLRMKFQMTGEYLAGSYFFLNNLVLVEDCSTQTVRKVVEHLIDEGNFRGAFKRIDK